MARSPRKKAAKAVQSPPSDSDSDTEGNMQSQSQPDASQQSQEIDTEHLTKLVARTTEQKLKRRQKREKEIEQARSKGLEKVSKKREMCRIEHEKKLRTIRQPQVERLGELLQQKIEVERHLKDCYVSIDQSWSSTLEQMQVAVDDLIEDLSSD